MALTQVTKDVLHNNQSNITVVGTLESLTVSGTLTAAAGNIGNLKVTQDIYGGAVGFNINPVYRLDVFGPGTAGTIMRIGSSYYQSNYMAKADLTEATYTAGVDSNFGQEAYSGSDFSSFSNAYPYSLRTYGVNRVTIAGNGANVTVNITTPSTSTTTGALIVKGGVGVAGNVSATNLTGTLLTASQPNITSVGTLSSLSVTGNLTVNGTLVATNTISGSISGSANNASFLGGIPSASYATTAYVQTAGQNSQGTKTVQSVSAGVPSNATGNNGDIIYQY